MMANTAIVAKLSYAWSVFLGHNTHFHQEPIDTHRTSHAVLSPLGCEDDEIHWYRIQLTVTDAAGLQGTDVRQIYPHCGDPLAKVVLSASGIDKAIRLNWTATHENNLHKYEIQKGTSLTDFVTIGEVASKWKHHIIHLQMHIR